ncbi:hypothetical protein VTP01DRAFT_4384 [Rhizomucor pusillus]|uniref:uncharacterized protein n=1 Tax=Rhizomucor pusillus TaxID=4840 RepID=UPI003744A1B0
MSSNQGVADGSSPRQSRLQSDLSEQRDRSKPVSRSGSVHNKAETDLQKLNFRLSEQVEDLKYQLSNKNNEVTKLQETLTRRTAEHDEKMKKMREIFAQATKNLDGYRASIAEKDAEIDNLREELGKSQARERELQDMTDSLKRDVDKLGADMNSARAAYGAQIKQLESKTRQLSSQLEQTKNDYSQYKRRATQLLESNKTSASNAEKIAELENMVKALQLEKSEWLTEKNEHVNRVGALEQDIRQALERVQDLESKNEIINKLQKENAAYVLDVDRLRKELTASRDAYEQAMQEASRAHQEEMMKLASSSNQHVKPQAPPESTNNAALEVERQALQDMVDSLKDENSQLREQIKKLARDKENHVETISKEESIEVPDHNVDVYASISKLLSPLSMGSESRLDLEKQVQKLREMLDESEDQVAALRAQEKVLKAEIRKLDAFDRRQNLNVEYLKNVFLKFCQAENKEYMIPVLAKLLSLDDAETEELRKSFSRA